MGKPPKTRLCAICHSRRILLATPGDACWVCREGDRKPVAVKLMADKEWYQKRCERMERYAERVEQRLPLEDGSDLHQ